MGITAVPIACATPEDGIGLYQGCSVSPDGLCVLTSTTSDARWRLYNTIVPDNSETPLETDETDTTTTTSPSSPIVKWEPALMAPAGDTVRSYCWYPQMNSQEPATCCFLATSRCVFKKKRLWKNAPINNFPLIVSFLFPLSFQYFSRDQPVHLWDAYTGQIRATYRPYNTLDEMESPTVVAFSPDGATIYTGGFRTNRLLHVFDLAVPGRVSTVLRLGKTRRSSDGQKGIVSAVATKNASTTTTTSAGNNNLLCVGTYSPGSIYLYDTRSGNLPTGTILEGMSLVGHGKGHFRRKRRFASISSEQQEQQSSSTDGDKNKTTTSTQSIFSQARAKWFQSRAQGGITQLQFAPNSDNSDYYLYSASRRSDAVLLWDLRMLSGNSEYQSEPLRGIRSFATQADTNQRLQFDVDRSGRRIYIGGLDARVRCYDTSTGKLEGILGEEEDGSSSIFDQAVNGVSLCNTGADGSQQETSNRLVAATGERQFPSEHDLDQDAVECQNVPGKLHLLQLQEHE